MTPATVGGEHNCELTLFVACFNEEIGIIPTLETVLAAVEEVGCSYEILIIDDASTDKSVSLVRRFMAEHPALPITLYVNDVNQGLGVNFSEAAFRGRGRYYRLICGDNVESKQTLVAVFSKLGAADMIIPYPAAIKGRTASRKIISRAYTKLVNLLSGYHISYYNGLAVHLRYNVMRWQSNAHGFGFQADLVTRLLDMNATYVEVPVTQQERPGGVSKAFTMRNICSVGHTLLEILIRRAGKIAYPRAQRDPLRTLHVYNAGIVGGEGMVLSMEEARGGADVVRHARGAPANGADVLDAAARP